ncbi:hypothetical protein [Mycolicibacterium frederiksbergense]|uniref:hypothetical protein n=1 Tax=Mycolicibacterium frederiksbergense TaxID=117567 RepID=UPI00247635B7|nr:hypothetical protein [Mycolicibacterium frederiksbergense]
MTVFALMFVVNRVVHMTIGHDGLVTDKRASNAKIATVTSDFDAVCLFGSISNAAVYAKPYKIIAFHQSAGSARWNETTVDAQARYAADPSALSSINVVACLSRTPGTEVRTGSCDFESGGVQVSIDRYAVEYTIDLHEAKTGKPIKSLGTVKGTATDCPMPAMFNSGATKLYARPDTAAVEEKLAAFATE